MAPHGAGESCRTRVHRRGWFPSVAALSSRPEPPGCLVAAGGPPKIWPGVWRRRPVGDPRKATHTAVGMAWWWWLETTPAPSLAHPGWSAGSNPPQRASTDSTGVLRGMHVSIRVCGSVDARLYGDAARSWALRVFQHPPLPSHTHTHTTHGTRHASPIPPAKASSTVPTALVPPRACPHQERMWLRHLRRLGWRWARPTRCKQGALLDVPPGCSECHWSERFPSERLFTIGGWWVGLCVCGQAGPRQCGGRGGHGRGREHPRRANPDCTLPRSRSDAGIWIPQST